MNESLQVPCPYCGEPNWVEPEPEQDGSEYVEDCSVCCQPIVYRIEYSEAGSSVEARKEND